MRIVVRIASKRRTHARRRAVGPFRRVYVEIHVCRARTHRTTLLLACAGQRSLERVMGWIQGSRICPDGFSGRRLTSTQLQSTGFEHAEYSAEPRIHVA